MRLGSQPGSIAGGGDVRGGVRGAFREHMIATVFKAGEGGASTKVVVADEASSAMLSHLFRVHELRDHNIHLIERLEAHPKEPVPIAEALYLIAPTSAAASHVVRDWEDGRKPYHSARVFATGPLPATVLQQLASSALRSSGRLRGLVDALGELAAPEPLLGSLELPYDIQRFFGGAGAGVERGAQLVAERMANVLEVVLRDAPAVRYWTQSPVAAAVAARLQLCVKEAAVKRQQAGRPGQRVLGSTVVVLDRSADPLAPLLHEHSYQAMLHDLQPPAHGVVRLPATRAGEKAKEVAIDAGDGFFHRAMHRHIGEVVRLCRDELEALQRKYPEIAALQRRAQGRALDVGQLGDAVHQMQPYKEAAHLIDKHTDLAQALMHKYNVTGVKALAEAEQMIASGEDAEGRRASARSSADFALEALRDPTVADPVRQRLALLLVAALGPEYKARADADGNASAGLQILAPWNPKGREALRRGAADWEFNTARYEPQLKRVAGAAVDGSLPDAEFPFVEPPTDAHRRAAAHARSAAPQATADAGSTAFGARAGGGRFAGRGALPGAVTSPSASPTGADAVGILDLGHGDKVPLRTKARTIIVMVGGATRSEARSCYEVAREKRAEVLLLTTSMIRPDDFVTSLGLLASGAPATD